MPLARPMEVGPRPLDGQLPRPTGGSAAATRVVGVTAAAGDAVKATREYVAGDAIKLVHWPATARAGELMVKDLESPGAPMVVIAVDLQGGPPGAVEAAASRAAGLAVAALRAGIPVVLLTAEAAGPASGRVTSPVEVGRRLARAVGGRLPAPPPGTEPVLVSAADQAWGSGR